MKRATVVLLGLALCVVTLAWASSESGNAVASSEVSATITLTQARLDVHITNDGANPAWVKVWGCEETAAAITTATSGARKIAAGEGWTLRHAGSLEGSGLGYCAITHITGAGLTTTLRYFAK